MEEWEFGLQRVINFPQKTMERKQSERTYLLKTLAGCPVDKNKIERYYLLNFNYKIFFYIEINRRLIIFFFKKTKTKKTVFRNF